MQYNIYSSLFANNLTVNWAEAYSIRHRLHQPFSELLLIFHDNVLVKLLNVIVFESYENSYINNILLSLLLVLSLVFY